VQFVAPTTTISYVTLATSDVEDMLGVYSERVQFAYIVLRPVEHAWQPVLPLSSEKCPTGHVWHGTVELALYWPLRHSVQLTDPVPLAWLNMWPAGQPWHAIEEFALYCPTAHTVQLLAPAVTNSAVGSQRHVALIELLVV